MLLVTNYALHFIPDGAHRHRHGVWFFNFSCEPQLALRMRQNLRQNFPDKKPSSLRDGPFIPERPARLLDERIDEIRPNKLNP
jgi:hypothetical protein